MQLADRVRHGEQPRHTRLDDGGFIMVVLLIGMAVAAVWMSAALPSWRQRAQRERELELVYRGEQYARALAQYYCKTQTFPPNIEVLVSQRYLRKKYLDPVTGTEFAPLGGLMTNVARGGQPPAAPAGTSGRGAPNTTGTSAQPGITGVRSTSQGTSIRVYNQQQVYSQWPFDAVSMMQRVCTNPGGRGGPAGGPGGGRAGDPTGRGGPAGGRGVDPTGRGGPPGRGGPVGPGVNPGGRGPGGATAPPRGGAGVGS